MKTIQLKDGVFLVLCFGLLTLMLLNSCALPTSEDVVSGFEESEDTGNGIDWLRFNSNDPYDYQKVFTYLIEGSNQDTFASSEVLVKKNSGYAYSDFGMVFCASADSYLALVIDTQKSYSVLKSVNGTITRIIDWTTSDTLNAGYGVENRLKIEQSTSENFDIYLNDTLIESFTEAGLVSGLSGYFVYVASEGYENLDVSPVEVWYAQN